MEQLVCIMSCFVWDEKANARSKVRADLEQPFQILRDAARRIAKV